MADRFFDTELCEKEWYHNLTALERCFFRDVLLSKCDCVGVWTPNQAQTDYILGTTSFDFRAVVKKCNGNIEVLESGKWFIVDFCDFQYGELTEKCPPHRKYIALLKKYGLYDRVMKGYQKGISTLQEEEEEEEEDISSLNTSYINSSNPVTNGSNRINMHIASWNGYENLPHFRFTSINMKPDDLGAALRTLGAYSDDEISQAITNYSKIKNDIDMELFPVYPTFAGFMANGVEKYADDAKPFERCRRRKPVGDQTDDARKRALDELARLRGQ